MHFNLIGPGRVGLALAHALINTNQYTLLGVYHPRLTSAKKAVQSLGFGTAYDTLKALPEADITFITTKDPDIESIVQALAKVQNLKPKSLIVHASGILSSDVLKPLKEQGTYIGSLHPLKAFVQKNRLEQNAFKQIYCAVEGDKAAVIQLTAIGRLLDATVFPIHPKEKATYHTAAIMASNYLVTLAAEASTLFECAGIPKTDVPALCTGLMQTSLDNLKQSDTVQNALTGPLMRGDIKTIQKHLKALESSPSKTAKTLYKTAGIATLPLTNLSPGKIQNIKALFQIKDEQHEP
ncbi:MAG: DUF2520 domain-containing protein [Gammaproteobacteria bacterium]|nr:DUF2520 domain-containing protein [Gammaproteobacteria bacterium]